MTTGYQGSSSVSGGTSTLTRKDNIQIQDQGDSPVLVMGSQHYQLPSDNNDLKWFRDQFEQVVQKLDKRIGNSNF